MKLAHGGWKCLCECPMFRSEEFAALIRRAIETDPTVADMIAEIVRPNVVRLRPEKKLKPAPMPPVDVNLVLFSAHLRATMIWEDAREWKNPPRFVDVFLAVLDDLIEHIDEPRLSSNDVERVKAARAQALTWAARWEEQYATFKPNAELRAQLKRRSRARRATEKDD